MARVELQHRLTEWRARAGVPGVSAAVRVDGRLHWSSEAADGAFAGGARFPIYSITKTLTAICVLRLSELGALALADPAARWVPDAPLPDTITVAHLLRHTSGIGDYGPLACYHDAVRSQPGRPWTRQQFLDAVLPRGFLFPPGAGWAYSNIGYMLLADTIERAAGKPFGAALHDVIVAPLALRHTFELRHIDDLSTCVPGYGAEVDVDRRSVDVRGVYHPGWCAPRVVASTAEEITLVFDALVDGRLLKPETMREMLRGTPLPDTDLAYGMGIGSGLLSKDLANYGHGGGGPGYNLEASIFPETPRGRIAMAVFVNGSAAERPAEAAERLLLTCLLDAQPR
jgi:D-alanyl-D-alanine carboxypeptidase